VSRQPVLRREHVPREDQRGFGVMDEPPPTAPCPGSTPIDTDLPDDRTGDAPWTKTWHRTTDTTRPMASG
jgi:hypothetical protein